jgi:hypothetical protein
MAHELHRSYTECVDEPVHVPGHGPHPVARRRPVAVTVTAHVHRDDVVTAGQFTGERIPRVAMHVQAMQLAQPVEYSQ